MTRNEAGGRARACGKKRRAESWGAAPRVGPRRASTLPQFLVTPFKDAVWPAGGLSDEAALELTLNFNGAPAGEPVSARDFFRGAT